MFTIEWQYGDDIFSVCAGNNISAWYTYWAISRFLIAETSEPGDSWIAVYDRGYTVDPRKGDWLPMMATGRSARIMIDSLRIPLDKKSRA